ncbi:MAG: stage II sporulation protein M [Planctomycetota bacterium]|jgi:uncharacterized membrane protein SpoIIM required for sporulation|nr:stage II sporulation protein M [Planctomycetota bacterium]
MNGLSGGRLRSYRFRKERERNWQELEGLVARIEKGGVGRLTAYELSMLPVLYRHTISSLSVARSISLDRNLLEYLETLVARSYICVYANKTRALEGARRFVRQTFPQSVRRHRWAVLTSATVFLIGSLCAYVGVLADMGRYDAYVAPSIQQGRGLSASTEDLREVLYDGRGESGGALANFASRLFTHNSQVGIMSFALGFVACIPTAILVFKNGLVLGAMTALHSSHGLGGEFLAWIVPHGVTEIGALCLFGAAGFVLGYSLLVPGSHTRLENLARNGRDVASIAIGGVMMLFLAALLEGFFRQWVQSVPLRCGVAFATFLFWAFYFRRMGRET